MPGLPERETQEQAPKRKERGHKGHKRPKGEAAYHDPYNVPSAFHCEQMIPYGLAFGRLFPRFHPSWLQRVQTPVPHVPAVPFGHRGYIPGDRGRMWVH